MNKLFLHSCLLWTLRMGAPCRHLKSYEHMGMANVTCGGGCTCEEATVDSWHKAPNSQVITSCEQSSYCRCMGSDN